jgi:hypothetical protein
LVQPGHLSRGAFGALALAAVLACSTRLAAADVEVPVGFEFQINGFTPFHQAGPVVASTETGERLRTPLSEPASLDIDADGSTAPLTDGLLATRLMFGFDGSALIDGALAVSAFVATSRL